MLLQLPLSLFNSTRGGGGGRRTRPRCATTLGGGKHLVGCLSTLTWGGAFLPFNSKPRSITYTAAFYSRFNCHGFLRGMSNTVIWERCYKSSPLPGVPWLSNQFDVHGASKAKAAPRPEDSPLLPPSRGSQDHPLPTAEVSISFGASRSKPSRDFHQVALQAKEPQPPGQAQKVGCSGVHA